jgi:prepilin-type N-terminal cleavage/methylation domain-containing protein
MSLRNFQFSIFNFQKRDRDSFGFTLIELLVVVAIIGLLLSIVSVALTAQRARARDARRVADLKAVKTGMDLYYDQSGGYPDAALFVAGAELACGAVEIVQIPKDPSYPIFQYAYAQTGGSFSGCGATVYRGYNFTFYIEKQSKYYIMDQEGIVRDQGTGAQVSLDSLL